MGRIVLRRGYGNQTTLSGKWRDPLLRLAFASCVQFPYAAGKNTSDMALALDAIEALLDGRANAFCVVACDSDFTGLCRKLRERDATVHVVGATQSPAALRVACDQFFEWKPQPTPAEPVPYGTLSALPASATPALPKPVLPKLAPSAPVAQPPKAKRRHPQVVEILQSLSVPVPDGSVDLGRLDQALRRADPHFSPKTYGHARLLTMVRDDGRLALQKASNGHWSVRLADPVGAANGN